MNWKKHQTQKWNLSVVLEEAHRRRFKKLDLSNCGLSELPAKLFRLTHLREIDLSGNSLRNVPLAFYKLYNLTELLLKGNQITRISPELGRLKKLTKLSLSKNKLASIPPELGKLQNLKELFLDSNQLTSIPSELGELQNLTSLVLSGNQLTSIPSELGELQNLKELFLGGNQLTNVPSELGKLQKLTLLTLFENQLTSIPSELGELQNLTHFWLSNNYLTSIPPELSKLEKLKQLYLHDNQKLAVPSEVLGPYWIEVHRGSKKPAKPRDILEYLFRLQVDRQPLNEAKLIFVGFGAVGKTSLVNRLYDGSFDPNSKKTDGIQITPWNIQLKNIETRATEEIILNVWDFGGQEIMHSTHQFFLTERSLYVLVLNGRQGHEDSDAEYWLELIQSFGADSPVIVVLNKMEEHPFDVNRRALREKFPAIREFVETDCETAQGIEKLKETIERETDQLEDLRAPFPGSWVAIKDELSDMKDNYISFEKYREICCQDGEEDIAAQNSLAVHLHNLGIALNYKDDPRLRDTHVLNPRWVTSGIYTLLNDADLTARKGELTANCLTRILDPGQYPSERHGFLLDLMRKFELCLRYEEDENRYLIPDLLDKQQPEAASEFSPAECLNFRYTYPVLPEGLIPRFIVRTHVLSQPELRWRTGVILNFEGDRALVKADPQDRFVTISIDGSSGGLNNSSADSRRRLLAIIRSDFDRIHSSFKFKPQELVPVPGHPAVTLRYQDLLLREKSGQVAFSEVVDGKLIDLNVQELLNGVDLAGSRRRQSFDLERRSDALRLFYSYSHKDERLRDELETHLKILERQGLILPWHDRRIMAGEEWADEIDSNLKQADVILLLISADFIASDYCYELELTEAMARHEKGETKVIPIFLRPADCEGTPFAKLQGFPTDQKAVTQWSDRDAAWLDVETGLKEAFAQFKKGRFL